MSSRASSTSRRCSPDALRPIEPPERLSARVESTLSAITEQAAAELSSWADELSESELESLRDPRNWVRPVVAVAVGGAAAGAPGARRRAARDAAKRRDVGLLAGAERALERRSAAADAPPRR